MLHLSSGQKLFSQNIGKLFSKLKLVTDNLLFRLHFGQWLMSASISREYYDRGGVCEYSRTFESEGCSGILALIFRSFVLMRPIACLLLRGCTVVGQW